MLFEELLEVVGAGGKHTAVSAELDIFDHHGDVAVLAFKALLVQQLQEDTLVFVVHVLHRLRHLQSMSLHTNNTKFNIFIIYIIFCDFI